MGHTIIAAVLIIAMTMRPCNVKYTQIFVDNRHSQATLETCSIIIQVAVPYKCNNTLR